MELFTELTKYFITIISILNPIGAIPVFLALTKPYSQEEISKIATSCATAVFFILLISSVLGDEILHFFGIHIYSFRIAGGIIVGLSGLSMLRGEVSASKITQDEVDRQSRMKEIGIIPLAIPMLAGPGTITTSIIQAESFDTYHMWGGGIIVMLIIAILVKLILTFSRTIRNRMGRIAINVMTRIMGLIILAVAIEHMMTGIKQVFN